MMDVQGNLILVGEKHQVEYEPESHVGGGTLFLRIKGGDNNVPIYVKHIDEVIDMLQKGKDLIDVLGGSEQ